MNNHQMQQHQQLQHQQQFSNQGAVNGTSNAPAPFYITTTAEAEDLKRFLATAPQLWTKADDPPIRSYPLSNGEAVSCIFWRGKFFITGTDIVKILVFRFAQAGRPVLNGKKFEEGIFSDLRNLKTGSEAILEEPKSEFLEFLFKHGCIRTQKKQKVFFWNCVPHESLFLDAIERDFKREGSLYHMNMMMNHTRYLQKQVAMMQASAIQHQFNDNSSALMPPPAPQMMPNTSRSASFSSASGAPANSLYPQPGQYSQNSSDPFLLGAPMRLPNGKINVNAPVIAAPVPMKTAIPRLPSSQQHPMQQQQQMQQPQMNFDYSNDFDSAISYPTDDIILSDYLNGQVSNSGFIDPSDLMNHLHEY